MRSYFSRGVRFLFEKNLLLTNSITSGLFMTIGDLVQQEFEYQTKVLQTRYDWGRTARMFTVGTVMGPVHHYYYLYLDKLLPQANLKTVVKKIVSDQLLASPSTILCFYYGMGILEKRLSKKALMKLNKK